MKLACCLPVLLAVLPFVTSAQTSADADRPRGEVVGARPSGDLLGGRAARRPAAHSEPVQQRLLGQDVNLAAAQAHELPDLYERLIASTRDERRRWAYRDWEAAAAVLARLNERYEKVRLELPLEERLRIRTFQGEFHTLRVAREVNSR